MFKSNLNKLISITSELKRSLPQQLSINSGTVEVPKEIDQLIGPNARVGFESSLFLFPNTLDDYIPDIITWNQYIMNWFILDLVQRKHLYIFGMDLFMVQFAISLNDGSIHKINLETGEINRIAKSLELWAKIILDDFDNQLGWSLSIEWQINNRPLRAHERLLPRIPFVVSIDSSENSFHPVSLLNGLDMLRSLHLRIIHTKDGDNIDFTFWENGIK